MGIVHFLRSEVLMAMKMSVVVFWIVMVEEKLVKHLQDHKMSQLKRPGSEW
jgi:hypothetical protein